VPCPDCGTPTAAGARFCHYCGCRLETPADSLRIGDRRIVTALFADLVGYTRLVDELDPEEVRSRVDGALALMGEAVLKFGGSLEKFIGDAVLAVFGVPAAHDDDALRACLCALEMQSCLARYVTGDDQPLVLRIGIATGEVVAALREVAGTRSIALTGEAMTTAARLQQLAEPNEILLDEPTTVAAEPRIGVEQVGERALRGQRKPVVVHRLRGERRFVTYICRRTGSLVGRGAEQSRLGGVLERTAATGRGAAVLVRGEPGVGKSRLLCEMEFDARKAGFAWMWLDNTPHGMDTPYRAVRNMVDWLADEQGVTAGVVGRELLFGDGMPEVDPDTLRLMLGGIGALAHDSNMALLPEEGWETGLLGLVQPSEVSAGLTLATQLWLRRLAARQPRCVVVDDFHWIDPSSGVLMEQMIRAAAELPLVVLAGSRYPANPAWAGLPHVEVMDLGGLDQAATEELGSSVAGGELDAESARWLHQRTAGNALFVGEIVRALRQTGHLARAGERYRIEGGSARRSVPLSLRALLGARIDALPAAQRAALELASVAGMSFSEDVLCTLGDCPSDEDLASLAEAGFLTRAESQGQSGRMWQFRHQLFLDAAYGRLLAGRRHELHATYADWLERSGVHVETAELARHRAAAGDARRALPLLEQAAREAMSVGAAEEAEVLTRLAASLSVDSGPKLGEG
jgi:adenylate cyclase